jgi:cytochrome P450
MGLPLVGETPGWLSNYYQFYQQRYSQYGPTFKSHVLGNPMVVISDLEDVKRLLQAEHKLVESNWPEAMKALFGSHGLLNQKKVKHRQQRQLLNQAYCPSAIQEYTPAVIETVQGSLLEWAEQGGERQGWDCARSLAFGVVANVVLGYKVDAELRARLRRCMDTITPALFSIPWNIPGMPFAKGLQARDIMIESIRGFIQEARDSPQAGLGDGRRNAIQLMLAAVDEDGKQLSDEELQDQTFTQFFAGYETTGSTMTRLLQQLKRTPNVLQRLNKEQYQLRQQYGPGLNAAVLDKMVYGEAVVKEMLRLKPIVDGAWRITSQDVELQSFRVPKGWTVQLMVGRTTTTIPEWMDTVDQFMPERWLNAQGALAKQEPPGFMPFGEGPRICLGMLLAKAEMKVLMAALSYDVDWTVDVDEKWGVVEGNLSPVHGLPVTFSKRVNP